MTAVPVSMTVEEHLLLNEVIEKQFGLSFGEAKKQFLESRLRPRLQALHLRRFIDYYLLLQYDLGSELDHLAKLITNNETYFFRETYQFEGLFQEGLARVGEGRWSGSRLKLLCAGCSSGEEPYTLNVFARRHAREGGPASAIDAFDIDQDRLRTARAGVYGPSSLRNLDEAEKGVYFEALDVQHYRLRDEFREGVTVSAGNILEAATYSSRGPYDVVFCRNVLIYFSEEAFQRAIRNFSSVLRPGGLLFLGHSESLIGRSTPFETVRLERCIAYRKGTG